ncbi:transposase [Caldibacillus thermoamylovorans]|uniref:transposase n=1 Tax=Caldibacillus thermoamylovorans TaxID=35841 RepID=UPI0029FEE07D|nr:transposase [Caldibacillus thermoamylovorans]
MFLSTSWQRCTFHFKKNLYETLPKKGMKEAKNDILRIYASTSTEEARRLKDAFIEKYKDNPKLEKAIKILEEGFEDTIQYLVEPIERHRYIRTTNALEHLNQEIRRREQVIRIFPNTNSAFRLIGSILISVIRNRPSGILRRAK